MKTAGETVFEIGELEPGERGCTVFGAGGDLVRPRGLERHPSWLSRVRVAVLISGRGSNMLALSEHKRRDPERAYEIVLVASNVPEARGLVLAEAARPQDLGDRATRAWSGRDFDAELDAALRDA